MSKRSQAEPSLPEFFIDRSLGSEVVPQGLRAAGWTVHVMADVYADLPKLNDDAWIPDATGHGWVLLTKDKAIRRKHKEHEAVRRARARMFCIANGNLKGSEMAERFLTNAERIFARCEEPGPYIWSVLPDDLELIYPR